MSSTGLMRPKSGSDSSQRYPVPDYVWYRGQRRHVYGIEPATHQGHRYYILRYKVLEAPEGAHTMAFGYRGQKGYYGVRVRADATRSYTRPFEKTGKPGRPTRKR